MTNAVRLMLVVGMLLLAATTRPVTVFAAESPAAGTPFGPAKTAPLPVVTAREIFEQLPSSIFDNTAEGLPDEEKERLLETGQCEFWEIVGETDDVIAFRALPFRDSAVALPKSTGSTPVAIGSSVPVCPTRFSPVIRLIRATAPAEVIPAGLFSSIRPCIHFLHNGFYGIKHCFLYFFKRSFNCGSRCSPVAAAAYQFAYF